jgi:hypothetical protein
VLVGEDLELVKGVLGEELVGINRAIVDGRDVDQIIDYLLLVSIRIYRKSIRTGICVLVIVIVRRERPVHNWVDALVKSVCPGLCVLVVLGNEVVVGADNSILTSTAALKPYRVFQLRAGGSRSNKVDRNQLVAV